MPRSQASQTDYENTCQTPLCNSGNPEGKSLKSQRIEKKITAQEAIKNTPGK